MTTLENPIIKILMERDDCTFEEALELFTEARAAFDNEEYEDPEDVLQDMLGLEPDYIFDLLM